MKLYCMLSEVRDHKKRLMGINYSNENKGCLRFTLVHLKLEIKDRFNFLAYGLYSANSLDMALVNKTRVQEYSNRKKHIVKWIITCLHKEEILTP